MILDTNAISALGDGNIAARRRLRTNGQLAVPVVVLGEYRFGLLQSRTRRRREQWLHQFLQAVRVLCIDVGTTEHYAELRLELKRLGRPIPPNDVWIGALCRQHDLPVMSRDGHFDSVEGLRRIDW